MLNICLKEVIKMKKELKKPVLLKGIVQAYATNECTTNILC